MTDPFLVRCLVTLRAEFNEAAPGRDKGADGWIGDAAHAARASDHNPDSKGRVLAVDIDSTGPWPFDFSAAVEELRGDPRLEYVIWNRRIASRDQGWTWRPYTGTSDPHTGHAHFSARHDYANNNNTAPWGLEDLIMPTAAEIAEAILNAKIGDTAWPNRTVRQAIADGAALRDGLVGSGAAAGKTAHTIPAGSPLGKLLAATEPATE